MNSKLVCELAKSLPGVTVKNHFGSDAFYADKRSFVTVWHEKNEISLRLNIRQQQEFLEKGGEAFAEIDNAWGRQGWTKVYLEFVKKRALEEALKSAWENSANKGTSLAGGQSRKKSSKGTTQKK